MVRYFFLSFGQALFGIGFCLGALVVLSAAMIFGVQSRF